MQVTLEGYYCPVEGERSGQSIGSTVSDAIVRNWLWWTATGDAYLATSVALLQVIDNLASELW